jgi:hypothetical protein
MNITYKIYKDEKYYILKRKLGNEKTDVCAFCGTPHIHGTGDGHRVPHCAGKKINPFGYYLITY